MKNKIYYGHYTRYDYYDDDFQYKTCRNLSTEYDVRSTFILTSKILDRTSWKKVQIFPYRNRVFERFPRRTCVNVKIFEITTDPIIILRVL